MFWKNEMGGTVWGVMGKNYRIPVILIKDISYHCFVPTNTYSTYTRM